MKAKPTCILFNCNTPAMQFLYNTLMLIYFSTLINHTSFHFILPSCRSDYYRTIKLFLIGNSMRGKTTLLRRLQSLPDDKNIDRTQGIDIVEWVYPVTKKLGKMIPTENQVHFLAWDFAGQVSRLAVTLE